MENLLPVSAGLDVHKDTVVACVRVVEGRHGAPKYEIRTFATVTEELQALADWLVARGVSQAAVESTGVYWKPLFNVLDDRVRICLVNARHYHNLPGHKTDAKDCQYLADLLACGMLRPSFIPPTVVRQMRDLTRQRTQLARAAAAACNRIQKVLEDANVKLGSVISDVLGESGRAMLEALIAGAPDPAAAAGPRMKRKLPKLRQALNGRVNEHHRFMLRMLLDEIAGLEALTARLDARMEEVTAPFVEQVRLLDTMPGVAQRAAQNILAEIGPDMSVFPTGSHLASWAGLCPGNNQSAGKRRSSRINPGNRWLKVTMVQCAWAASHTKGTHYSAFYRRLARRCGKKKALVALAAKMLRTIHAMLTQRTEYREPAPEPGAPTETERRTRALIRQLERLGHKVKLETAA